MAYNKDKDIVFVYRPDGFWNEHEYVYEMHHLEQMVPAPVTSYKDLTMQREDGILNIYCMSTRDYLKFYNDSKYWNLDLKEDFLSQTRSLWHRKTDKYDGQLFNIAHRADTETTLTMMKVDKEIQDAIKKHGKVTPPRAYEDQFYENIKNKKNEIIDKAL